MTTTITIPRSEVSGDWHVAPRDQGQIIERAWARTDGGWILRITDRSDRSEAAYFVADRDIVGEVEPWNGITPDNVQRRPCRLID